VGEISEIRGKVGGTGEVKEKVGGKWGRGRERR